MAFCNDHIRVVFLALNLLSSWTFSGILHVMSSIASLIYIVSFFCESLLFVVLKFGFPIFFQIFQRNY